MSLGQYERVSAFQEAAMAESHVPKLTPRSSYSAKPDKPSVGGTNFNYKPPVLRSASLLSLLALTLALVGVLEWVIVELPHGSLNLRKRDEMPQRVTAETFRTIVRRNDSVATAGAPTVITISGTEVPIPFMPAKNAVAEHYVAAVTTETIVSTESSTTTQPVPSSTSSEPLRAPLAEQNRHFVGHGAISSTAVFFKGMFLAPTDTATISRHQPLRQSMPSMWAVTNTSSHIHPGSTTLPSSSDVNRKGVTNETGTAGAPHEKLGVDRHDASLDENKPSHKVVVIRVWDARRTFLGNYLAICVAVLYRLVWVVLYNAFNLIEPFRQLMERDGALGEIAFFAFFQNQSNLLGPLPALLRRRWALAFAGTAYMAVNLLPALASAGIYVQTQWDCASPDYADKNNPCHPRTQVNVVILRIMQGLLGFAAIAILSTASLLLFTRSGLPSRPNSIATIASLMRHPGLASKLSDMPVNAGAEEMQRLVRGRRYRMGYWTSANGLAGYGIQPCTGTEGDGLAAPFGTSKHRYTAVDGSTPFSRRVRPKLLRFQIRHLVLVLLLLGVLGLLLANYLDSNTDDEFNRFFNGNTWGPRFIVTLAATVVANIWKSIEQDAIVMAPYNRLWKRPSSPGSTILMTPTSTPISSTLRTLVNRYFLVSTITMITLAAEGLNIAISGVPYANGQMHIQFYVSTYISIAILGVMIIVAVVVIIMRFQEPEVPRKPTTLGAVMSYLCYSRMLDDFEGMECLDQATRDQRVRSWNKKYEFTETVRRDGKLAWTVDDAFDQPRY